ncbi:MAG: hypothetical protein V4597_19325 [Pseudomonadota bacterium]
MTIRTETWPVAADASGLYLLGAEAWRTVLPVQADTGPHADVLLELARHDILEDRDLLEIHSTSWGPAGQIFLVTYYAAVDCDGPVLARWPDAQPITLDAARAVGRAPSHGGLEAPVPRHFDVLMHALRHMRFRLDADADCAAIYAHRPLWRQHLQVLEPALAEMYGGHWTLPRAA